MKKYLRHYKPVEIEEVKKCIADSVNDYNNSRPHGSLKGLTPIEAYTKPEKALDYTLEKKKAKALRIAENRTLNCLNCQTLS